MSLLPTEYPTLRNSMMGALGSGFTGSAKILTPKKYKSLQFFALWTGGAACRLHGVFKKMHRIHEFAQRSTIFSQNPQMARHLPVYAIGQPPE
jgi:hypothetical protein